MASTQAAISSQYAVQTVSTLPPVDTTITLGAALLGRVDDTNLNAKIIRATAICNPFLHFAVIMYCIFGTGMPLAQSAFEARVYSVIAVTAMLPILVLCTASLSRDLVFLTLKTFEFWFLSSLNWISLICSIIFFNDERVTMTTIANFYFHLALLVDANIYSRRWLIRSFFMGSIAFGIGLFALILHYTPRLVHTTLPLGQTAHADVVDLSTHCYSTMAFFFVVKVVRSGHLALPSKDPIEKIQCETYCPLCHLVSCVPSQQPKAQPISESKPTATKQLELVQACLPDVINTDDTIVSFRRLEWLVQGANSTGLIGLLGFTMGFSSHLSHAHRSSTVSTFELTGTLVGLGGTLACTVFYVLQAPLCLLRRWVRSLDAWFVSIQLTGVCIGVCDAVSWDTRALFVLPPWLWCHWAMLLDTFTPLTRQWLQLRCGFNRLVLFLLFIYPLTLVYWLFYSNAPGLRNREIFSANLFGSTVRMEAYSLLVSRVWTVWLWMGRFLWREVVRPTNAFKLLKYRVEFHVASVAFAQIYPAHKWAITSTHAQTTRS